MCLSRLFLFCKADAVLPDCPWLVATCFLYQVSSSVVVSGPLWTGPLHDAAYLTEMLKLAREWGWASTKQNDVDLEKLLNKMIDESDPQLPPGYIKLDEVHNTIALIPFSGCWFLLRDAQFFISVDASILKWRQLIHLSPYLQIGRRAKINSPPISTLISTLEKVLFFSISLVGCPYMTWWTVICGYIVVIFSFFKAQIFCFMHHIPALPCSD